MKTKTINRIINAKFDEWLNSITDEEVRDLVKENSILTGGAIASMFLKEKVNDFDFYFRNMETARSVARYYVTKNQTTGSYSVEDRGDRIFIRVHRAEEITESESDEASQFEKEVLSAANQETEEPKEPPYIVKFISNNAISLSGQVQLVVRFVGDPDKIHENYDFVHATNFWTSWDRQITTRPEALECLLTKELRYIGSKYPICSIIRTRKFVERGFSVNAGQYLKMCLQVNDLDLTNFDELREQIVGVDAAYFNQVLTALHDKDPTKVNNAYLVEILNRIFG